MNKKRRLKQILCSLKGHIPINYFRKDSKEYFSTRCAKCNASLKRAKKPSIKEIAKWLLVYVNSLFLSGFSLYNFCINLPFVSFLYLSLSILSVSTLIISWLQYSNKIHNLFNNYREWI